MTSPTSTKKLLATGNSQKTLNVFAASKTTT